MGRKFLDHPGGARIYSCANCDTPLTNRSELVSTVSKNVTHDVACKVPWSQLYVCTYIPLVLFIGSCHWEQGYI